MEDRLLQALGQGEGAGSLALTRGPFHGIPVLWHSQEPNGAGPWPPVLALLWGHLFGELHMG